MLFSAPKETEMLPDDSVVRYPVKKTQVTNYKDLQTNPPIDLKDPSNVTTTVEYNSTLKCYILNTKVGDQVISTPFSFTEDEYYDYTFKQAMHSYFKKKNSEAYLVKDEKKDGFSLKDMKLNVSPADRIFGPGGVKLNVQGSVEATMGIKYTAIDDPSIPESNRSKTMFDFNEDIQLNASASVGDKINFGMNYDTKSMFDFDSKKIKLGYQGKEDEIVKAIEAGNVSMATTNSLINGGTALFGLRTELQFGKLRINTVVAQQESQMQSVNTKGGMQVNNFEFKADQYDENRHFFLSHYFYDSYDKGMSMLPHINSPILITRIEVWVSNKRADYSQSRNIVGFADLAENKNIANKNQWKPDINAKEFPVNKVNNLYKDITTTYKEVRNKNRTTAILNGAPLLLQSSLDYEKVESARLLNTNEYAFNAQLGYLSLNSALQSDEVLAVAYEYTMNGQTYQVGEFSTDIVDEYKPDNDKSGALIVKLIKPVSLSPRSYTWDLMMKNVYYIGANNIQKDRFQLNISYQSDTLGTYINYLPEGKIKNKLLLGVMNLDTLNNQNKRRPDGIFDFVEGYTIKAENGRVFFPTVQPFGKHLAKMIDNPTIAEKYVYQQLYDSTKTVALQIAEKNKFKIYGSYRGSISDAEINLNATNIPRGSVRVTAGGIPLVEGVDYIVDYMSGTVTIINQAIKESNTPIQTSLENRTFSMQRKTLLGTNLSYDISKNFNIGGTIMHMYEKPLTMKTEIGNESAKNTLWGLNMSYRTESDWLTNLVDKIPFYEATQPSQITFNGEFAQLIAGHYENKDVGAYSYLDDFESAESRIDVKNPYAWNLSSTPFPLENSQLIDNVDYGKGRARMSWFMIDGLFTRKNASLTPEHIKNDKDQLSNHFVREINMWEIYPNRDVSFSESATMPVLNISYYPNERGPYNVDTKINSDGYLLDPKKRWGGMTRKMDIRDFETSNIEYLEFWLMDPFVYDKTSANNDGKLVINLGEISEDILKDGRKFYENGLPIDDDPTATETTNWGKVPTRQSTVYAFDDTQSNLARQKQDVGFDGLSNAEEFNFKTYKDYVTDYKSKLSSDAISLLSDDPFSPLNDPSGDNFQYFLGSDLDRKKSNILDRYKYFNNSEGNSPSLTGANEKYSAAGKRVPDVEDIDQDNTLNENESYFEYEIKLNSATLNTGGKYIVDSREVEVLLKNGSKGKVTWYQFKVPLRDNPNRINKIRDFKSIRFMRMYLTGFDQATFLRFGTMEFVRGDWRVYEPTLNKDNATSGMGTLNLSTVNIEANGERKPVNYVLPPGLSRSTDPDQTQIIKENEQSLSLRVNDLSPGDARAIYRNTTHDLRRYKRLQMFAHAEEIINETQLTKGELTLFLRLGSDYKNNYYEYEIPLAITPPGKYSDNSTADRYIVWPQENMFDFPIDVLKNLKLKRNKAKRNGAENVSYTSVFSEYDPEKPNNKISVIGNPSLSEINVIMIGVRNNTRTSKSGEVWVDELRLTDFDEKGGWAAQANVNIALSDLGTIDFSGRKETVGFGGLDQKLMERRSDDYTMYNIAANVELGKFMPEKAKVSLPLYYAYSRQTNTPEYNPFDQDITLDEALSIVNTKAEKDSIRSLAQEVTTSRSISINNAKVNIQSKTPMPYDPANLSIGYAYSQTENRNPTTVYDIAQNYRGTLNYSYSPLVKTWEPFKDTKSKSGSARFAKSLGFNYMPSNIGFNSNITRYYTETTLRDIDSYVSSGSKNSDFLSWSQSFYWDRDFNINWDLTRNLKISFQSGTRAEIEEPYLQVNKKQNRDAYEIWKDSITRSILSLGNPLNYKQTAKVTYQLPFRSISALDWVTSNIAYTSGYQWDRGAEIDSIQTGNTISNNSTLEFNNRLNLVSLYNKSSFLKKVNARFDKKKAQPKKAEQAEKKKKEKNAFSQEIVLDKDSSTTIAHGLNNKKLEISALKNGQKYKLKYKVIDNNTIKINNKDTASIKLIVRAKANESEDGVWKDIAEYSARGLMSIRSLSVNYSTRQETHITGYMPHIGDAFGQQNSDYGLAPGLGFAFGLDGGENFINRSWDQGWLADEKNNLTPAIYNNANKLDVRVQIEPLKGMKIELNAGRENNKRTEIQYMYEGSPRTLGGNFSMTTIALSTALKSSSQGNNYKSDAFEKFLSNRDAIRNRIEAQYIRTKYPSGGFFNEVVLPSDGYYDPSLGIVNINSSEVLIPAFIAAYTGQDANSVGLSAFPSLLSVLPNWTLSYDGLSDIPFIKDRFKSIRINHAYTCFYQVSNFSSYPSWIQMSDELGYIRDVLNGTPTPSSPFNIASVGISEMFNPLIGVDGTLINNMTLNGQFNNIRTLNLNMNSYQIIESLQKEIIGGVGYRINEFNKILGINSNKKENFNNDLNIKIDLSHKTNQALIRKIQERFTQATSGTTIITLRFSADYTMNRSVTVRGFYDRIINKPLITSAGYPRTDSNFGISVRMTLLQ